MRGIFRGGTLIFEGGREFKQDWLQFFDIFLPDWVHIVCPIQSYEVPLSTVKISLSLSHLVSEIISPSVGLNFPQNLSFDHFVPIVSLIFDLVDPLFLMFLDLFDPSFFQIFRSDRVHFFIVLWNPSQKLGKPPPPPARWICSKP